jgi:threonylcarbamoyladenosine tRNA methylthiotransferase MtaB
MLLTFQIETFGCKSNQYDSQLWRRLFLDAGWMESADSADVCLINTCAVTAAAERQARQVIRRFKRENQRGILIVAGCYGQLAAQSLTKTNGVDLAVGIHNPLNVETVKRFLGLSFSNDGAEICDFSGHTRAFIKVQDGCSHACSYCIVPRARGGSRSRDLAEVAAEAQKLLDIGHRELVLTGIRLGDFKPSLSLLVSILGGLSGLARLRLSSLEPDDVNEELIDSIGRLSNAAKHLHLPLQSGSDRILSAMGRPYSVRQYRQWLERIQEKIPDITFGTDLMVGFPGEAEEDFRESLEAVLELPISHLHVFTYSRRPGTKAAVFPGQIPEAVKKERSQRLRQAFREKQLGYWQSLIGSREEVLFETGESGVWSGLSEHYFRVRVRSTEPLDNQLRRVRLASVRDDGLEGVLDP